MIRPQISRSGVTRPGWRGSGPVRHFACRSVAHSAVQSLNYSQQLEAHVAAAGAEEGLEFRFDRIKRTPNTLEAHRLIWFAGREQAQSEPNLRNMQNAVAENLFRAYFIGGEDVGDTEVLKRIGAERSLDTRRLEELFALGIGTEELTVEEGEARARGVTGVPTFFVNGEPITSGAHRRNCRAPISAPP